MALNLAMANRLSERRTATFRAMGTNVEITVWANPVLAQQLIAIAPLRIELLEQSWSRFRNSSELNKINQLSEANSLEVSDDMAELLHRMNEAIEVTGGSYFPFVEKTMRRIGYDRNFEDILNSNISAPKLDECLMPRSFSITGGKLSFSQPLSLDAGGIGKGLAADILTREFMNLGAVGVLANIGGDLVAAGRPGNLSWQLGITNDADSNKLIGLIDSQDTQFSVATSSVTKRKFSNGNHHIIDPLTGNSAATDIAQVSVVSTSGWHAEVMAKAGILKGFEGAATYLRDFGLRFLIVSKSGAIKSSGVQLC